MYTPSELVLLRWQRQSKITFDTVPLTLDKVSQLECSAMELDLIRQQARLWVPFDSTHHRTALDSSEHKTNMDESSKKRKAAKDAEKSAGREAEPVSAGLALYSICDPKGESIFCVDSMLAFDRPSDVHWSIAVHSLLALMVAHQLDTVFFRIHMVPMGT
jgi:hypothetical protein